MVVGSELDGGRVKKEEVVEEALSLLLQQGREMHRSPAWRADVVMVGDRRFDIEGAKTYGIASIGVSYGYALKGELERAGADRIVGSVKELQEVLLGGSRFV